MALVGHTMSNGEWPIGGARNDRHNRAAETDGFVRFWVPEALQDPDITNILAIGTKGTSPGQPSFTSERYPYSGMSYMRAGWKPGDPYVFMYCAPWPVGGVLGQRNNNAIGLSAWGYDLLETGENGTYDPPRTPVKVNGQEQDFPYGITNWGHRGNLISTTSYTDPPAWRWHDSARFNVAEGVYRGHYGKTEGISGVTHQRIVHFARQAGVWVITDRLTSVQPHDYTLDWRFGIQPGVPSDFTDDQIKVDAAHNRITTERSGGANISLTHFASGKLAYSTGEERTPPSGYRIHDFYRVSADWKATGSSIVVTLAFPRKSVDSELSFVKPLNSATARGFDAKTQSGYRVLYQAAIVKPSPVEVGDLKAIAESIMLVIAPDGSHSGVVLGCKTLSMAGKQVHVAESDFEFTETATGLSTEPIYTPVLPVTISPSDSNVFLADQIVALHCATPGTTIRYTLNGSEPNLLSPVYREPIQLTENAAIRARAFRDGVTTAPTTLSCSLASVVTKAEFRKMAALPASNPDSTSPGLSYQYFEGDWQDLFTNLDAMTPVSSGQVKSLFDLSPRRAAATYYAFKYSGYFAADADGVYNFYAPAEFYEPTIMAGYELQVRIDGKEWYPETARHALGDWGIALQKGKHRFEVVYADLRGDAATRWNTAGQAPRIWTGIAPRIEISGPGLTRQDLASLSFTH